jgi:hypothetical protein
MENAMEDEKPRSERVVRDGMVAVLVSPGYGAGWSTWGNDRSEEMLFCPRLVAAIEAGADKSERRKIAAEEFSGAYLGGVDQLVIEWVREGEPIRIVEYDGSERIEYGTEGLVTP